MSKIQSANNYPDISNENDGPANPDNVGYPGEDEE